MALKKKKIPAKKKKSVVKTVKKLKKTSKPKNESVISAQRKKISSKGGIQKNTSKPKKPQVIKSAARKKVQVVKSTGKKKISSFHEKPVKKAVIKKPKSQALEKRKILELRKELDNLNKKSKEAVLIKDAEGRFYCCDDNCDQPAVTNMYCRYHYLALWKYLQTRKKLSEDKYLTNTIQGLIKSFGENVLHFVMRDFKNEKTFEIAIKEMNFFTGKEEEVIPSETDTNF